MLSFSGCSKSNDAVKSEVVVAPKEGSTVASESQSNQQINKEGEETSPSLSENIDKKQEIKKRKIVIDPGHSAAGNREMEKLSPDSSAMKIKDPGGAQGINSKTPEYVVAMQVALKLKADLEENRFEVIMTKTDKNQNPGNIERAEVGNSNNADLVIRIHCDSSESSSAKGASILVPAGTGYSKNIKYVSSNYGDIILNELVSTVGMKNRGISERNDLTGFNWSKVPVVLIEMGFMSNPEEDKLLNSSEYQDKLALGLSKGIIKALN